MTKHIAIPRVTECSEQQRWQLTKPCFHQLTVELGKNQPNWCFDSPWFWGICGTTHLDIGKFTRIFRNLLWLQDLWQIAKPRIVIGSTVGWLAGQARHRAIQGLPESLRTRNAHLTWIYMKIIITIRIHNSHGWSVTLSCDPQKRVSFVFQFSLKKFKQISLRLEKIKTFMYGWNFCVCILKKKVFGPFCDHIQNKNKI